jgi:sigma-E factor negative regulatory protein RseC
MIEELATVVGRTGRLAWVQTHRRGACSACAQGTGCATSVLGSLLRLGAVNRLAVEDHLGVSVDERVVIGIPDGLLVRASVAAYGLPLIALVTAAGIAEWLRAPELAVAAAGVAGLAAGLWFTGRLTGGGVARRRYQPVLLRREHPTLRVHCETGAPAAVVPRPAQTQT